MTDQHSRASSESRDSGDQPYQSAGNRPPRTSSARRKPIDYGVLGRRIVGTTIVACLFLVVFFELRREKRSVTPVAAVRSTSPQPTSTVAPGIPTTTPTPTSAEQVTSDWVSAAAPPSPTPTALPTLPPIPTRRRSAATPTPLVAECLQFTWSAGQSAAAWGQVLVEIRAVNRCGRVVQPTEVGFRVSGWREGDLGHSVTGHAMTTLRPGAREEVVIGLPGSITWYDDITVEPLRHD